MHPHKCFFFQNGVWKVVPYIYSFFYFPLVVIVHLQLYIVYCFKMKDLWGLGDEDVYHPFELYFEVLSGKFGVLDQEYSNKNNVTFLL